MPLDCFYCHKAIEHDPGTYVYVEASGIEGAPHFAHPECRLKAPGKIKEAKAEARHGNLVRVKHGVDSKREFQIVY